MLNAIKFLLKATAFAIVVLVLGNWIRIGNKTISDQVKTELSQAERSDLAEKMRDWAGKISDDAREGIQKKVQRTSEVILANPSKGQHETIPSSERQKLKALIRELNSPAATN